MPLLLTSRELQLLGDDPTFAERGFQLAQDLLTNPAEHRPDELAVRRGEAADGEHVSLLAQDDGTPLAVLPQEPLDAWLTALAAGLVARYFAPPEAEVLSVIGSGPAVWAYLRAVTRALPSIRTALLWSPDSRPALACTALPISRRTDVPVHVTRTRHAAERRADVLVNARAGNAHGSSLRPEALLLSEHSGDRTRTPVSWRHALRAVLTDQVVPRPGLEILLDGRRSPSWQQMLDGWVLRRAWQLNMGRPVVVD
ncbi:hypothetical protein [Saccharopolyspora sp. 5N708]|uniref:hypothetical protein n=1 Tax=Saccharopolyspora sp. 5N708 TaxID=3457424 RepID=UPI003FD2B30C